MVSLVTLVCKQYFAAKQSANPNEVFAPIVVGGDNPQCNIPEVHSRVSTFNQVTGFTSGLLSSLVVPRLGRLSDGYGRTRLMAFASVGGILNEVLTIVVANFPDTIDYRWLVLGYVFEGATGSFTGGALLTQSYTSDCTPPSKRAVFIGWNHACLATGLALGPLLAGYFVKWTGSLVSVFYVLAVCHLLYVLTLTFVVPESLAAHKRDAARQRWAKESERRERAVGSWLARIQSVNPFEPLAVLWPTGPGTSRRLRINLVSITAVDVILVGVGVASGPVIILYSEYMFGWGNLESSQFVSTFSFLLAFVLLGAFPLINYLARTLPLRRRAAAAGVPASSLVREKNAGADSVDLWVLRSALATEVVGAVGFCLSQTGPQFFASGLVTALSGLGSATTQAAITKHVPQQLVGQVFGAVGMLHALARVICPVAFNGIYAATVGSAPRTFFYILTAIFSVTFLITLPLTRGVFWEKDEEREALDPEEDARIDRLRNVVAIDEDQGLSTT